MAVPFAANVELLSEVPNFTRDMFETKAAMKAFAEYMLPPIFLAVCKEDGGIYLYNKDNMVDEETGKWRAVSGGSTDYRSLINKPENLSDFNNDLGFIDKLVDNLVNYYNKTETYSAEEIDAKIGAIATLSMIIVDELPEEGSSKIIYLVKKPTGSGYVEWIYTLGEWADIGDTDVDLSEYVKKSDLPEVAKTGNYNDLIAKPQIPENVSDLVDDVGIPKIDDENKSTDSVYSSEKVEQLVAKSTGSSLEKDITSSITLGGINEGDTFATGTTFTEFVSKLIEKYIAPTISIAISPNKTLYEKGVTVDTLTITATVGKKSEEIEKVEFLVGSEVKETKTEGVAAGGAFSFVFDEGFSSNTKFSVRCNDKDTQTVKSADTTVNFVLPYYYGVLSGDTVESLTGLTKDVSAKGSKTYAYTADNEYLVIMYDASYADLTSIKDQNNFDNKNNFTKKTVTIGGNSFKYYVSTGPKTVSNFKFTFA